MCIAKAVELYENLSPVVKHFSSSIKNRETLNSTMKLLSMTPKHLLSWCSSQMAHFLDAWTQINKVKSVTALLIHSFQFIFEKFSEKGEQKINW